MDYSKYYEEREGCECKWCQHDSKYDESECPITELVKRCKKLEAVLEAARAVAEPPRDIDGIEDCMFDLRHAIKKARE